MVMEKKKNDDDDQRDKISDLPDAILHHIFSFLNMEEAVRSSVYSKRWRNLWTSLPTLNFEYEVIIIPDDEMEGGFHGSYIVCNYHDADAVLERIAGLVDKVFILRDDSNNIQRFSLICPYLYSSSSTSPLDTWVTSALKCNVQELVIEIPFSWWLGQNPIATCSLFNSKSLTFLRLVRYPSECLKLGLPDSVCLPCLKTLFLESVEFQDDYDGANKLVSGCPVLESLTIANCGFGEHIKISSLSLKHLVFVDNVDFYEGVQFITPNLISLRCRDFISNRYYIEDISSLIKADIFMYQSRKYGDHDDEYMPPEVRKNQRAHCMLKFLRAIRNVRNLTLSAAHP